MLSGPMGATSTGFSHEAMLYDDIDGFVTRTASFIREGIRRDEDALVVLNAEKNDLLRAEIGATERVRFADMATVGHNPARFDPGVEGLRRRCHRRRRQVPRGGRADLGGPVPCRARRMRTARGSAERRLRRFPAWRLLCPYDASDLSDSVLREAERNHPVVWIGMPCVRAPCTAGSTTRRNRCIPDWTTPETCWWSARTGCKILGAIRGTSRRIAKDMGFVDARVADIALVASELATNSVRHGGGAGWLRIWRSSAGLILDAIDAGSIAAPLAGRERPAGMDGGYGLWIANQVADLVQLRMTETGSIVRAHFAR